MPNFRVKSVKIYTGQKNLHVYIRGVRDKYEVCHNYHETEVVIVIHVANLSFAIGRISFALSIFHTLWDLKWEY